MHSPTPRTRAGALVAAAAITLAACGSDDDAGEPTAAPATDTATTDDGTMTDDGAMTDDMDMADMDMGDPTATPAEDVEGAALARGEFQLLDTRPQGYDDLAGTAVIARHAGGTTVTTAFTGLPPNVDFISHVHAQPCGDENGGPHYQFVLDGPVVPPNEIHLAFTSDADGNGFMTAENAAVAGAEAVSLVIHPAEFVDNKVACVDFVPDDPAAVAAAIAAGPAFDADSIHSDDDMDGEMDESDDMDDDEMDDMGEMEDADS